MEDCEQGEEALCRWAGEEGFESGADGVAGGGGEVKASAGAVEHGLDVAELGEVAGEFIGEVWGEPDDKRDVGCGGRDFFAGVPGVREVGADEDEVAIIVGAYMVADEALAAGVEGEGEFEFGVMVPLEGNGVVEAAVEAAEGAFGFGGEELSKWLDLAHR